MLFSQIKQWRWRDKKKRVSDSSFFTVMISRGLGKVRGFNISSSLVFWSALVLLLYLVFSTVAISRYFGELKSDTAQSDLLQQLQNEIEGTKKTLYQARQRLKFLEDYIVNSQKKQKKQVESPGPEIISPGPANPVIQGKTLGRPDEAVPATSVVDIKNLKTERRGGRLSVKFRLIKIRPERNQIKGYLFMIAANSESAPMQLWTYPKAALENGEPINYKHGQLFKVRNYRIIRGKFFLDSNSEKPSLLKILVYDESGKLILNKEFSIKEAQKMRTSGKTLLLKRDKG